jgi:acyl carrier protein
MTDLDQQVRKLIIDHFLFGDDTAFTNDDSFLDKGFIDSTGVLELVALLEQEYGIKIQDHELVPDNLDSVNNLVRFISHRRNGHTQEVI